MSYLVPHLPPPRLNIILGQLFIKQLAPCHRTIVLFPLHIQYISSPNQCLIFATHAHTIATCFAVVSILYHLFLVFFSTPYLELCLLPWHYTSIWPFSSLLAEVPPHFLSWHGRVSRVTTVKSVASVISGRWFLCNSGASMFIGCHEELIQIIVVNSTHKWCQVFWASDFQPEVDFVFKDVSINHLKLLTSPFSSFTQRAMHGPQH